MEEHANNAPTLSQDRAQQLLLMQVKERTMMQLLDATGRKLAEEQLGIGQGTWSYVGLPAGAYFVRFEGASGISTQKVVLDRH